MMHFDQLGLGKVGILFSDFGPYHVARIEAFADEIRAAGGELVAFRYSVKSQSYSWEPTEPKNVETVTLFEQYPTTKIDSLRLAYKFSKILKDRKVKVVFLPSYSPLPNFLCLLAAKIAKAKTIMMNETWKGTEHSGILGKACKHIVLRLFDGALVGGRPQAAFAASYGINPERIYLGYDVVNVDHFRIAAARWKLLSKSEIPVPNLPDRYFLNLGRFVEKKNLTLLIEAYAEAIQQYPDDDIALVLVGAGDQESALVTKAKSLNLPVVRGCNAGGAGPRVVFYPFQQIEHTPIFFARAEAFILPSLREEWGLVVNEAMSCGTPVIVSRNAGCAIDLVLHGQTGFQFDPNSVTELANYLKAFISNRELRSRIGLEAQAHIQDWRPQRFGAEGLAVARRSLGLPPKSARVVFVVESLAVSSGGTALEVATIASALAESCSHEVSIIACVENGPDFPISNKVRVIRCHGAKISSRWPGAVSSLRRILRDTDVVFVTGIWGLFDGLGLRLARRAKTSLFVRICGMLQPYIMSRNAWKKRAGLRFWCEHNLRNAQGLIVNSVLESEQVKALGLSDKLLLIRNGVVPPIETENRQGARQALGIGMDERVLLYLSRIHPKKGLDQLLAGMVAAHQSGERLPILLVAGGFSDSDFERRVMEEALSLPKGLVRFIGEVEGAGKERAFAASDAFVLPSQSEGLPNAVLEAMARRLPVVITPGCNIPEVAERRAGMIVQYEVAALGAACAWVAKISDFEISELGANAQKLVHDCFSLKQTIFEYDSLIRRCMSLGPS